jgi:hypothetical protein
MGSWQETFRGNSHLLLLETIAREGKTTPGVKGVYARYTAFVQSSGMGKSRTMDEVAKQVVLIPINLRPNHSTGISETYLSIAFLTFPSGYPPADTPFREFFKRRNLQNLQNPQELQEPQEPQEEWSKMMKDKAYVCARCDAFLTALFKVTLDTIKEHSPNAGKRSKVAVEFREYLERGITFEDHGTNRKQFAAAVVEKAETLVRVQISRSLFTLTSVRLNNNFRLTIGRRCPHPRLPRAQNPVLLPAPPPRCRQWLHLEPKMPMARSLSYNPKRPPIRGQGQHHKHPPSRLTR